MEARNIMKAVRYQEIRQKKCETGFKIQSVGENNSQVETYFHPKTGFFFIQQSTQNQCSAVRQPVAVLDI